jgi:hypothetical protein
MLGRSTNKYSHVDTSIHFERLTIHTSSCNNGFCPVYHFQIDSNRQAKLVTEEIYKQNGVRDSMFEGSFVGHVADSLFETLIVVLQASNLNTWEENSDEQCCDWSTKNLIIRYNGVRKQYRTMFPPLIIEDLINLLYDIVKSSQFARTSEVLTFEK